MGVKLTKLPKLNTEDLTDRETLLLQIVRELQERVGELEDEIARLKGEKEKPKIKPSRLEPKKKDSQPEEELQETDGEQNSDSQKKKKRPGSAKRKKTVELPIHESKIIQPVEEIPHGSKFKGYQDYTVQELIIKPHNIRASSGPLGNPNRRDPKRRITRGCENDWTLWGDAQELLALSISSLPCHPT